MAPNSPARLEGAYGMLKNMLNVPGQGELHIVVDALDECRVSPDALRHGHVASPRNFARACRLTPPTCTFLFHESRAVLK
jgi:hypothetical protein